MIAEHIKSSENTQGYKPKSIHVQRCSGFPAKRECGWRGRGKASIFQRLSSEQSQYRVQMEHKNHMWRCQLPEQPCFSLAQHVKKLLFTIKK